MYRQWLWTWMAQNSWVKCNNSVAKIAPCSCHLVLKQCSSFSQSIYHYLLEQCSNRLFKQIQSVSKSEILYRISHGNLCHLIESIHQTHSNKNRICSDNWSSCKAHISSSLVKVWTLFEYQFKTACMVQYCLQVCYVLVCYFVTMKTTSK